MKTVCELCPRHCALSEGATGICRGRGNRDGVIVPLNYGKITSIALDPIEKKPLYHFHPGEQILSVGSFGCNLKCPFCQNHSISMAGVDTDYEEISVDTLVKLALKLRHEGRNIGVAFTYNEPLISYEFVHDVSVELKKYSLCSVLVTNGQIMTDKMEKLLPYIDAMNIDLKGFSQEFYDYVKGDFETVKNIIRLCFANTHVELTTLIIPDKNDSEEMMDEEARFIASLSDEIPLHISRFFPRFKVLDRAPTSVEIIERLCKIARGHLKYVYKGNV